MKWNWAQWIVAFALMIGGIFIFSNYLNIFVYGVHRPLLPWLIITIASTILIYIFIIYAWFIDEFMAGIYGQRKEG